VLICSCRKCFLPSHQRMCSFRRQYYIVWYPNQWHLPGSASFFKIFLTICPYYSIEIILAQIAALLISLLKFLCWLTSTCKNKNKNLNYKISFKAQKLVFIFVVFSSLLTCLPHIYNRSKTHRTPQLYYQLLFCM